MSLAASEYLTLEMMVKKEKTFKGTISGRYTDERLAIIDLRR